MLDFYFLKKKNVGLIYNQDDLLELTKKSIKNNVMYLNTQTIVKRFKNSNIAKDLSKAIATGTQPLIIIGYVGFEIPSTFEYDFLEHFKDDNGLGIVGGKLVDRNFRIIDAGVESPIASMPIWRNFGYDDGDIITDGPNKGKKNSNAGLAYENSSIFIDGNFIIIRRDLFNEVGGINPDTHNYWAMELCLRMSQNSIRILYVPKDITHWNYFEHDVEKMKKDYELGKDLLIEMFVKLNNKDKNKV